MKQLPLIERAIAHGERIAIRSSSNETTYQELLDHSQSMAIGLLAGATDLGEARIAYLVPPGSDYITAQWGIWRAGGIAVPLSLAATEQELEYTLIDAQVSVVIVSREFAARVDAICRRHPIHRLILERFDDLPQARLPTVAIERDAMILYTSGTTSKPKGVVSTHACIEAQIGTLVDAWRWRSDDRIPLFLPLHHIHGIINILSCALWSGAQIEAFDRFEVETIFDRVAGNAYSLFMAVPTIYVKMIEALESVAVDQREPIVRGFSEMRLMVSGSAALPASVHEQWTELTSQRLLERYGMTEIGMALSNPYDGERRAGAVGMPLPGVEIRLRSESGELVSDEGVAGEIQVRGANVFQKYWNKPEATDASFVDGWFQTGDIAVVEQGYYRIMGRNSVDIIKSGGYKLSALEIEASLLDHPAISQCAVVGVSDRTWGEAVAAAVVLVAQHTLDLEALRAWCRNRISKYKIPHRLLIVDRLPRNAMGKVTKPAVSRLFTDQDSDSQA